MGARGEANMIYWFDRSEVYPVFVPCSNPSLRDKIELDEDFYEEYVRVYERFVEMNGIIGDVFYGKAS